MNFLLREFFPHLKLKDKNLSWPSKLYIYMNIMLQIWIILVIGVYIILPYIAKDKYVYSNIAFYTYYQTNDSNVSDYFDKVQSMIVENSLYSKKMNIDIYLINNHVIYTLLNPVELLPYRQTFATTYQESIFINQVDIGNNKAYASTQSSENLDAILMHESVHVMQNSKYGWLYTTFRMPYWVKEGYPIYSARILSQYKEQKIIDYLIKTKDIYIDEWDIFSQDQFYGLMVKHAIEKMHISVDDLHLGKVDYEEVLDSLLKEYSITKE